MPSPFQVEVIARQATKFTTGLKTVTRLALLECRLQAKAAVRLRSIRTLSVRSGADHHNIGVPLLTQMGDDHALAPSRWRTITW